MWCMNEIPVDKMLVDKRPVKIAREEKILAIFGVRAGKMLILSKYLIYCTDGQVN